MCQFEGTDPCVPKIAENVVFEEKVQFRRCKVFFRLKHHVRLHRCPDRDRNRTQYQIGPTRKWCTCVNVVCVGNSNQCPDIDKALVSQVLVMLVDFASGRRSSFIWFQCEYVWI